MRGLSVVKRALFATTVLSTLGGSGCAARGHIATPDQIAGLQRATGLSASGKITLWGPRGRFGARLIFGVARPDALRIEIPSGAGLRFLLVARDGSLRADLPGEDAMFEGGETREAMNELFGIDLEPRDLVSALLGSPPDSMNVEWRFESVKPAQMTLHGKDGTQHLVTLDQATLEPPGGKAFAFGPRRQTSLSLQEMAKRLGLKR